MAKYEVIKKFRDKHTAELHKVGDEIEITKQRADEILSKGAFVKLKSTRKKSKEEGAS